MGAAARSSAAWRCGECWRVWARSAGVGAKSAWCRRSREIGQGGRRGGGGEDRLTREDGAVPLLLLAACLPLGGIPHARHLRGGRHEVDAQVLGREALVHQRIERVEVDGIEVEVRAAEDKLAGVAREVARHLLRVVVLAGLGAEAEVEGLDGGDFGADARLLLA